MLFIENIRENYTNWYKISLNNLLCYNKLFGIIFKCMDIVNEA